ncbi:MAG: hypothetical protein CL946_13050 [Ectothiorhodospiraceae bacterium]|nr:hypothetical protein [Ectothiorhodospiraceae bacterium]
MTESNYILGDSPFVKKLNLVGLAAAGIGIILSVVAAMVDWERFIFNYLVAFAMVGGIAVTGVFFSMLQFLTRSGWSAAVRRIPEFVAAFVPFLIIMLVPIIFGLDNLYHHWMHPDPDDVVLQGKSGWLNAPFFIIRIAVYYLVWVGLYYFIVGNSFRQDTSDDATPTKRNWIFSAPGMILYAITVTFAAFDLLMSLYPHWYSTIYGVYYFSGSFVGTLALVTIIAVGMKKSGLMHEWLTPDRFHDLGKLLFAFNIFWAYIAFSQYLLIWYANLPEEIIFFKYRVEHGWQYVSLALVGVHFLVPFFILLSESAKRNLNVLLSGAIVLLIAHYIDMYWLVMPYYNHDIVPFGWIEIAPVLALFGLMIAVIAWQFKKRAAIPVRDPFLAEATQHS